MRNQHNRLATIEAAYLETQVARLRAYMRGLSNDELNLIVAITEAEPGREFSQAELAFFETYRVMIESFSDLVHEEFSRLEMAQTN